MVPSLATRATLAAWPSNGVNVTERGSNLPSLNATPIQENEQGRYSVFIFNLPFITFDFCQIQTNLFLCSGYNNFLDISS